MKKKGFTLLEIMLSIAIVGLVFLTISPIQEAFIRMNDIVTTKTNMSHRVYEIVDFIRRDVDNSIVDDDLGDARLAVLNADNTITTADNWGNKVIIRRNITGTSNPEFILYEFVPDNSTLNISIGATRDAALSANSNVLLGNVQVGRFKFADNLLLYDFDFILPARFEERIRHRVSGTIRVN